MRGRNLAGVYDQLAPDERFRLVLGAAARQDETEVERLAGTCPRYRFTYVGSDPAFTERLRASRQIAVSVGVLLVQTLAKLTVIKISREYVAILSMSLVAEYERGYHMGWEAGCEHAWLCAGMAGPSPRRDYGDLGERTSEGQNAEDSGDDDELALVAEALATAVATLQEAFTRVCRAEMGVEPETVMRAWLSPMQDWLERAKYDDDGTSIDPDMLEEYEGMLLGTWHELLQQQ